MGRKKAPFLRAGESFLAVGCLLLNRTKFFATFLTFRFYNCVMKTPPLLLMMTALAVSPCFAQSTNGTSTPPNPIPPGSEVPHRERLEHVLQQMQGMSPAQQALFLQNHPRISQYLNNHPEVAKGITSGSEAGAGIRDLDHPRVTEVNHREQNLDNRINQGVANGTLTSQQAANLDQKVQNIQQQEAKDMASDNGHLTRADYRQLNHEKNRVSHQLHKDKK